MCVIQGPPQSDRWNTENRITKGSCYKGVGTEGQREGLVLGSLVVNTSVLLGPGGSHCYSTRDGGGRGERSEQERGQTFFSCRPLGLKATSSIEAPDLALLPPPSLHWGALLAKDNRKAQVTQVQWMRPYGSASGAGEEEEPWKLSEETAIVKMEKDSG